MTSLTSLDPYQRQNTESIGVKEAPRQSISKQQKAYIHDDILSN